MCGSLSITTSVSLLANDFDVPRVLHGQVTLAAVNQMCVIHEAMTGCKNLKVQYRIASKMLIFCDGPSHILYDTVNIRWFIELIKG